MTDKVIVGAGGGVVVNVLAAFINRSSSHIVVKMSAGVGTHVTSESKSVKTTGGYKIVGKVTAQNPTI